MQRASSGNPHLLQGGRSGLLHFCDRGALARDGNQNPISALEVGNLGHGKLRIRWKTRPDAFFKLVGDDLLPTAIDQIIGPAVEVQVAVAQVAKIIGLQPALGIGQVMRLASNLILTRILSPEDFGLMALVTSFLIGLAMFSDMGFGPSIMQSKRGDDPVFLDTIWTLKIIRGFGAAEKGQAP